MQSGKNLRVSSCLPNTSKGRKSRSVWVRWPPQCESGLLESPEAFLLHHLRELHRPGPGRSGRPPEGLVPTPARKRQAEPVWPAGRWHGLRSVKATQAHSRLVVSSCSPGHRDKETDANCLWTALDRSLIASCKDSIGWMFSKLDANGDLYLEHGELAAINLDKYEVCIRPFFNSCDSYKDGKVSTAEWCLCFWRESESGEG